MVYEYDGRNDKCPLPLVKLRVLLRKVVKGDICVIKISDRGSLSDIPKYLENKGYSYTEQQLNVSSLELRIIGK